MSSYYIWSVWNCCHSWNNHGKVFSNSLYEHIPRVIDWVNLWMASNKNVKSFSQVSPLNIFISSGCLGKSFLNQHNPRLNIFFLFANRSEKRYSEVARVIYCKRHIIINRNKLFLTSNNQLNNIFCFIVIWYFEHIVDNLRFCIGDGWERC